MVEAYIEPFAGRAGIVIELILREVAGYLLMAMIKEFGLFGKLSLLRLINL